MFDMKLQTGKSLWLFLNLNSKKRPGYNLWLWRHWSIFNMKYAVFHRKNNSILKIICFNYKRFLSPLISVKMSHWTTLCNVPVPSYRWKKIKKKEEKKRPFRQNAVVATTFGFSIRVSDKAVLTVCFIFWSDFIFRSYGLLYFLTLDVIISY
jgi:hypothetical protein